jgi:peptide/nickel transport system substrate-binding protein
MSPITRIGAAATLVALAACGDRVERAPGAGGAVGDTPEPGGTVVIAELADLSRPLPIIAESSADGSIGGDVMFSSLLRGEWRDGRLHYVTHPDNPAALARSWELVGPDSAALRYHLQPGLLWSDGRPITAHDVVWTYDMLRNPDVGSPQQNYAVLLDSVVADDDTTVTFHFRRQYPEMLFHSGIGIGPRHVFEGTAPGQLRNHPALVDPSNGRLPVSGPFMIGEWRRGQQVTLVPNPNFPVRPHLERIVWRVIPEATTRLTELLNGTVDISRPLPFDQIPTVLQRGQGIELEREEKRSYDYVGYNPRTVPAFADPEIRRALSLAADVPGLIQALQMDDWAEPAAGPYSPIFADMRDERLAPLPFDTAEAGRILTAKGWTDRSGDGVRQNAAGQPFRFTLLTNAGNSRRADIAQILQQQWRRIGVDMRLQTMETNTFFERLREKRFEAALAGWQVGLSPDLVTLWGAESPFNFVSYDNPRTTGLMEQALAQRTAEAAAPFWRGAAAQIVADQPYTWLFYFDQVDGRRSRVRGMTVNTYGAYQNTWEWWIPRAEQRQRTGAAATDTSTASGDTAAADTTG